MHRKIPSVCMLASDSLSETWRTLPPSRALTPPSGFRGSHVSWSVKLWEWGRSNSRFAVMRVYEKSCTWHVSCTRVRTHCRWKWFWIVTPYRNIEINRTTMQTYCRRASVELECPFLNRLQLQIIHKVKMTPIASKRTDVQLRIFGGVRSSKWYCSSKNILNFDFLTTWPSCWMNWVCFNHNSQNWTRWTCSRASDCKQWIP